MTEDLSRSDRKYLSGYYPERELPRIQIVEALKYIKEGSVLDLGCGNGNDILYLASLGFKVKGVDKSRFAVQRCLERTRERGLEIECEQASILDYEINEGYDMIICNFVLHMFRKDWSLEIIEKIKGHTKLKGINIVTGFRDVPPFFNERTKDKGYFREKELVEIYNGWRIVFNGETISKTLQKDESGKPLEQMVTAIVAQRI